MAQEHDLFDDIIEISKGFDFLKNPLGGVTDALDPSAPQWNPADYKERPRGNTIPCLTCKNEKSGCTACMDVCPVNAIEVEEDAIEILDSCRKCGLCAAACPTEAIISPRLAPKNLYDDKHAFYHLSPSLQEAYAQKQQYHHKQEYIQRP